MKTPKECKAIEELIEVEMDMRAKLIIRLTQFLAQMTVTQRTVELLSGNPTEELLEEMQRQVSYFKVSWQEREVEVKTFLAAMNQVIEMRKELTPKFQPIFIPGGGYPGMGGMSPLQ